MYVCMYVGMYVCIYIQKFIIVHLCLLLFECEGNNRLGASNPEWGIVLMELSSLSFIRKYFNIY